LYGCMSVFPPAILVFVILAVVIILVVINLVLICKDKFRVSVRISDREVVVKGLLRE